MSIVLFRRMKDLEVAHADLLRRMKSLEESVEAFSLGHGIPDQGDEFLEAVRAAVADLGHAPRPLLKRKGWPKGKKRKLEDAPTQPAA